MKCQSHTMTAGMDPSCDYVLDVYNEEQFYWSKGVRLLHV